MPLRKSSRIRNKSEESVKRAMNTGNPFLHFYSNIDDWNDLLFDDLMMVFRAEPAIPLTSHDLVDAWERNMFRENRSLHILADLNQLLRNKMVVKGDDGIPE